MLSYVLNQYVKRDRHGLFGKTQTLSYIFYLVAIVLATILGLTEYVFAYKMVYFFKIVIIVFVIQYLHETQPNFRNIVLEVYEPIHELKKH